MFTSRLNSAAEKFLLASQMHDVPSEGRPHSKIRDYVYSVWSLLRLASLAENWCRRFSTPDFSSPTWPLLWCAPWAEQ